MKIAAILTCFNRKEKTMACLDSFLKICPDADVYLTNDGCTDGTPQAVAAQFPSIHIIEGSGNLFWSRGMYTAWKEAIKGNYDYYLWLNDDIELYPDFMDELMACEQWGGGNCIISGLIADKESHKIIYGGTDANKILYKEAMNPQEIKHMNGNVVLIPQSIVDKIGIMDPKLHHDLGDVDYGLTAIEHGFKVYTTRKAVALGYTNNYCRVRKWNSTFCQRWKRLHSPLGSNPRINFYYRKKHFGWFNAATYYVYLYVINLMPDWMIKMIFKDKYMDK